LLLWPGVAMMAVDSLAQLALTTLCSGAKPLRLVGMGLHPFPFQLNLSFYIHRITQLNS
jgi:hypothetical protein